MKTLKEFMVKRKYVAVIYDKDSQQKLREWAEENGFDLSVKYDGEMQDPNDFKFHTTVFYSTNEIDLKNRVIKQTPQEVTITGFKFLGENNDVPVLTISVNNGIKCLRQHFEDLGLEDKWPDYQPHISVSYAKQSINVDNIKLPDFRPKYDKIVIEDIKE